MTGGRQYLPAMALLAFSVVWVGALMAWPRDGQPVAALFPANSLAYAAVTNAGAESILGFGAIPGIVVVQSDRPEFIDKLYDSGALVVVRAPAQSDCLR